LGHRPQVDLVGYDEKKAKILMTASTTQVWKPLLSNNPYRLEEELLSCLLETHVKIFHLLAFAQISHIRTSGLGPENRYFLKLLR
jgi:hypothetical protein